MDKFYQKTNKFMCIQILQLHIFQIVFLLISDFQIGTSLNLIKKYLLKVLILMKSKIFTRRKKN